MGSVQPVCEPSTRVLSAKNPGEIRLLTIADPHCANSSPESWKADYQEVVEATINQVLTFGVREDVDAVIWPGDLFHRKSPARNPLGFVESVMRLLKKSGIPNAGVAGNHDLKWSSLAGLPGQALSLLIEAGVFQLLDRQELLIAADGFSLRVAGASFSHGRAEECRAKTKKGATWLMSVGHFWFGSQDGTYHGEPMFSPDFLGQGEPDIYVIGHKHDDQGIQERDGKKYIVPGSISLTGEKANDHMRAPAAAYLRITQNEVIVRVLRPKVPAVADLINMEKRAAAIQESVAMEAFLMQVSDARVTGNDPRQILDQMDVPEKVREKANLYLDMAEAQRA